MKQESQHVRKEKPTEAGKQHTAPQREGTSCCAPTNLEKRTRNSEQEKASRHPRVLRAAIMTSSSSEVSAASDW